MLNWRHCNRFSRIYSFFTAFFLVFITFFNYSFFKKASQKFIAFLLKSKSNQPNWLKYVRRECYASRQVGWWQWCYAYSIWSSPCVNTNLSWPKNSLKLSIEHTTFRFTALHIQPVGCTYYLHTYICKSNCYS